MRIQVDGGTLHPGADSRDSETWLESGFHAKMEPIGLADAVDMGSKRKEVSEKTPHFATMK